MIRKSAFLFVAALTSVSASFTRAAETVDFVKDVAPLLAQHCVKCHGPEKRQGGMRLDTKKFALEGGDLGPLFVAGDSKKSKLIELVVTNDTDERMPKKAPALKAEEIALLKKWIDGGANWPDEAVIGTGAKKKELWSLKAPIRPTLPDVKQKDWPRNPIDTLTLAKMEAHGLKPSPEADRTTMLRRLHLDLTGLPPTPEDADAFAKDTSADAYEKAVDRLLASPHFGERWGRHWLDIARYADTNGYEKDRERSIWAYRDWVINALNKDMPFDQFTIEQNAGDMLPNASEDQKIATGFHRNTMINEEGGIDVEEFRYEAIVDRVKTTSTAWLGLTVACAQCHTHKYDPITHKEYWSFFAFLNNSDEPELELSNASIQKKREEHFKKIADLENAREALLAKSKTKPNWKPATITQASAANGSTLAVQPGGVVLAVAAGAQPEQDTYELVLDAEGTDLAALKLDVLTDGSLPSKGPGRAPNGNFVLSEISATATAPDGTPTVLKFANVEADVSQKNYDVSAAIDGNPSSGWAIDDGSGKLNKDRSATFTFADGVKLPARAKLRIKLAQLYGAKHTLGKFRVSLGYMAPAPTTETPEQTVARKQQEWETSQRPKARNWTQLKPSKATSKKYATMNLLPDNSVLASGDLPNNDVYEVEFPFEKELKNITAIRLEALTHDSLPDGGPGRAVFFSRSNFLLTEFETRLFTNAEQKDPKDGTLLKLQNASQSHSEKGDRVAAKAIDGVIDTGWSVGDRYFDEAAAVFEFKEPLNAAAGSRLQVQLHQFYIHQMVLGRFRISVSTDPLPAVASGLPADAEEILLIAADKRSPEQAARLRKVFLSLTLELADQNKLIKETKRSQPRFNTSMVLTERAPENARKTHIHHRGEFLSLRAEVQPDVPEVLPQLPKDAPKNRLTFAKWLVARENPLTARVTMNRLWYQLFGRGITQTLDDFGVQGEKPNNPELLDWLAVEFMEPTKGLRKGEGAEIAWSFKAMIRLMVTSNTYRQSSRVPADAAAKDPVNEWFARFPRVRVEAEVLRDIGMSAAGILNPKIGGPSIYPPQPASVTSTVYGGYQWNATQGAERYRRGMYTFFKRAAPFGAFMTFDAPNADECCVKRNRTNTPLGALAMLNDVMFMEFSRAMAQRVMKDTQSVPDRTRRAFRLALTREPDAKELAALTAFYEQQLAGFKAAGSKPKEVAVNEGQNTPANTDLNELAAWTMLCRTVLNLDEAVTRE